MRTETSEVVVSVDTTPIKGEATADPVRVYEQAELARDHVVDVDYHGVPGTCGDERGRAGYRDGSMGHEARPSVFGGPGIYGLGIAEMTGQVSDDTETGEVALAEVDRKLRAGGILNGGHAKCAAAVLPAWMQIVVDNPDAMAQYVSGELEEDFDPGMMREVLSNTAKALASGRYEDWNGEQALVNVMGEEKAGRGIEILVDAPHEGLVFEKQMKPGKTIDQTPLYENSVLGKGSFVVDYPYADEIDAIVTSGPDAVRLTKLARHAREAMYAAIAAAVPNMELYQGIVE